MCKTKLMKLIFIALGFCIALLVSRESHAEVRIQSTYAWVEQDSGMFEGKTASYQRIHRAVAPRISEICVDNMKFVVAYKTNSYQGGVSMTQVLGHDGLPKTCK